MLTYKQSDIAFYLSCNFILQISQSPRETKAASHILQMIWSYKELRNALQKDGWNKSHFQVKVLDLKLVLEMPEWKVSLLRLILQPIDLSLHFCFPGESTMDCTLLRHAILHVVAGCALLWSVECSSLGLGSLPSCTGQMPQFTGGRISMSCLSCVSFETFCTAAQGSHLCLTCSLLTFSCGRVLLILQSTSAAIEITGRKPLHQIYMRIKTTPVPYYQQKGGLSSIL